MRPPVTNVRSCRSVARIGNQRFALFISRTLFVVFACMLFSRSALAIPALQIYIEGGTYNSSTESWTVNNVGKEGVRLWTIGNVDGPGGVGTIDKVHLSIAYNVNDETLPPFSFQLTPGLTGDSTFTDTTVPDDPIFVQKVTDGSRPSHGIDDKGKENLLAPHGIYGTNTIWHEFDLGAFSSPGDSPIADFTQGFPNVQVHSPPSGGQINVYTVHVVGPPEIRGQSVSLHFDLYNQLIDPAESAYFAPFSHDADANNITIVPEPTSIALWSLGVVGMLGIARRRKRSVAG